MRIKNRIITTFVIIALIIAGFTAANHRMSSKSLALHNLVFHAEEEFIELNHLIFLTSRYLKEHVDQLFLGEDESDSTELVNEIMKIFAVIKAKISEGRRGELKIEHDQDVDHSEAVMLIELERIFKELVYNEKLVHQLIKEGRKNDARLLLEEVIEKKFDDEFMSVADRWIQEERRELSEARTDYEKYIYDYKRIVDLFAVLSMAIVLFLSVSLIRRIGRRLDVLVEGTRAVAGGEFQNKIEITGKDELAELGVAFNEMTEKLAVTHVQLLEQCYQSGMTEAAANILHNIKNSFSTITTGCERILMVMEDIRPEQLNEAIQQLKEKNPAEAGEYQDLLEYVGLGMERTNEILAQIKDRAREMENTSYDITSILVEHYRSNKSGRPMQWSSVYDLLFDAVNLLEGSYLERAELYIDPGIKDMGKILTHRIVFLQILSNLFTNAVESVHRSGNSKGMIRVSAFIDHEDQQEYIHLQIHDNGEGIEAANLEEIFRRHYTSKKNFGFSGLGLHWCSNAVLSLNGRIYAESAGKGKGATMHLLFKREARISAMI